MADEEKDAPPLSSHIKLIYCLIVILFLATTSCFIVNFLYILEIREDLSLKCSCPDGEKLLSLELRVEGVDSSESDDTAQWTDRKEGDTHHRLNKGDHEEDITLVDHNMERDRRKAGKDDSIFYRSEIMEAYAKLPVTISVESIADFCNATISKCPKGIPGVKGEPGSAGLPGLPGPPGARGPPGVVFGGHGGGGLPGPKGDRGATGEPGVDAKSLPGPKGEKGDRGDTGKNQSCKGCYQPKLNDKWMVSDDEDVLEGLGSGATFLETLMNLHGNIPGLEETDVADGWFPVGIPGPPGPPGQKGDPGADGKPGQDGPEEAHETSPCCNVTSPEAVLQALSKLPHSRLKQFKGPSGPTGPPGQTGPKGDTGIAGDSGRQGLEGPVGPPGPKGKRGQKGSKGQRGRTGPGGPRGTPGRPADIVEKYSEFFNQGSKERTESEGPTGSPLALGRAAIQQGPPGPPGPPGPVGSIGLPGTIGPPGINGSVGSPGPPGPPGQPGPPGSQGPPNSQEMEYSGSGEREDQFTNNSNLNLICMSSCNSTEEIQFVIGPPGPRGPPGKTGPRGAKGNSQSRRFIIGPPGPPGLQGLKGDPGSSGGPGEKGERGDDGIGVKGEPGVKGSWGDPGLDGLNGLPGPEGPQGPPGEKGQKGDKGLDGMPGFLQGPMGPPGPAGVDGIPGVHGMNGSKGDQGEMGKLGEKGASGLPGIKGEKGMKGYCITVETIVSDSQATPETSLRSILEEKPPPFERDKECKLQEIEGPFEQIRATTYWGSWMRDAAPTEDNRDKIWITTHFVGNTVTEYANLNAARVGFFTHQMQLPDYWDGSGLVVYKNSLYYHSSGTQKVVRFDLSTQSVAAETEIPEARYEYNQKYMYKSETTYVDFAVDEAGLWVIYTTNEGMLVVSKLNATDLSITRTIHTNRLKSSSGDAFIICGVLYATKSPLDVYSSVDFAYDLYANEELTPIDIPIVNRYKTSSMLAYYPNDRLLYGYDKGYMMLYNVTLQSEDG